jgi:hypothetical protein
MDFKVLQEIAHLSAHRHGDRIKWKNKIETLRLLEYTIAASVDAYHEDDEDEFIGNLAESVAMIMDLCERLGLDLERALLDRR